MGLLGDQDEARVRAEPEEGKPRMRPGEDPAAVGMEEEVRVRLAAHGEDAVGRRPLRGREDLTLPGEHASVR